MKDFEKLGAFYLGRPHRPDGEGQTQDPLLYDSRDLVTHAMIIGMTGSGKTGLGIALLEEAAIDGVPAIAIDPKGDLGNLLLTFPALAPADFRPWINVDDAARKNMSPDDYAAQQAAFWKEGLAGWGEDGDRIARFRKSVDLAIYTPGSSAGIPLSILRSLAAPPATIADDAELFGERLSSSVTGLLSLVGVDADPVKSREHILLSTIVGDAWKNGENLELTALIQRIQQPPVTRIGVFDVDSFYPAKDRFELAMQINGLLAAPGFQSWLDGESLDIDRMLFTADGKPRISIVSIAHLGDRERMFIVALIANEVLAWMRRQSGTTSLRALLYVDEVAGYMPPVANPPSKPALLTLLKQARAFGLGVVLSTQNPGDLDYKGLSNLGTWMIGRLQTDRDRSKVLEGLEGALASTGRFDRDELDRTLSGLSKRIFLMHNVHDDGPEVFETRWTMSYLRGPLTRDHIRKLMSAKTGEDAPVARPSAGGDATPAAAAPPAPPSLGPSPPASGAGSASSARPVLAPDVPQFFVPPAVAAQVEGAPPAPPSRYEPRVFASAQVGFVDPKLGVREIRSVAALAAITGGPLPVDWSASVKVPFGMGDLGQTPESGASFSDVPAAASRARSYAAWAKEFGRWIADNETLVLLSDPSTGLTSKPGESERDFRVRLQLAVRERRDADKAKLQQKYAPKLKQLEDRERRAEQAVARETEQASHQKMQAAVSVGASVLGALFGRKLASAGNVGRASTAARSATRAMKESEDIKRAQANAAAVVEDRADLESQLKAEIEAIDDQGDALTLPLQSITVRPKKTAVTVDRAVLVWLPVS